MDSYCSHLCVPRGTQLKGHPIDTTKHLQYTTGKVEWTNSDSLTTPGQVIREGKDVSDVIHSAWETAQYQQEHCLMPSYILIAQHQVL